MSLPARVVSVHLDRGFFWLVDVEEPLRVDVLRANKSVVDLDDGRLAVLGHSLVGRVRIEVFEHAEWLGDSSTRGVPEKAAWLVVATSGPLLAANAFGEGRSVRVSGPGAHVLALAWLDEHRLRIDHWPHTGPTPGLDLPELEDPDEIERQLELAADKEHEASTGALRRLVESGTLQHGTDVVVLSAVASAKPAKVAQLWWGMDEWLEDASFTAVVDGKEYEVATRLGADNLSLATYVRKLRKTRSAVEFEMRWGLYDHPRDDDPWIKPSAPASVRITIRREDEAHSSYTLTNSGLAQDSHDALESYWRHAIGKAEGILRSH